LINTEQCNAFLHLYVAGLFTFQVSVIWAASSVVVQWVFTDSGGFDSPLALTYICTSMFTVYLPGYALLARLKLVQNPPLIDAADECKSAAVAEDEPTAERDCSSLSIESDCNAADGVMAAPAQLRSHQTTARIAAWIAPVWFSANLCYNASLRTTSVTSSTIISCTSSLWTLLLSALFAREKLTWRKAVGVALCVAGGTVVGLVDTSDRSSSSSNSSSSSRSLLGDLLAVASAALYGVYSTLLAVHVPDDTSMAMPLLFGYLGIITAAACAPLFALYPHAFAGLTSRALSLILLTGVFDSIIADLLWARAVVLTTPTVASVGLALTIPLAFVTDFILHSIMPSAVQAVGAVLVVSGFVLSANGR
jgi:solute carrier family 35, member F5